MSLSPTTPTVHPHACGEHKFYQFYAGPYTGSSPRLWGTPHRESGHTSPMRFIPTPVGNTEEIQRTQQRPSVHPHACGEHSYHGPVKSYRAGSSPRLWGTHFLRSVDIIPIRFIPTPVGNTREGSWIGHGVAVHPHACGEHSWETHFSSPSPGSSPRLWGTPCISPHRAPGIRFIPTPVGNTDLYFPQPKFKSVHPHACGEHKPVSISVSGMCGSSPRLWGTRHLCLSERQE